MSDVRTVDLVMPRLGETMEKGVVRDWLKSVGDTFERGEPLVEIETDKTIAEMPALKAGRLVEVLASSGEALPVGAPIGRIEVAAAGDEQTTGLPGTRRDADPPIRATPAARRVARERGISLGELSGSGRFGRIEVDDVTGVRSIAIGAGSADDTSALMHTIDGPHDGVPVLLLHGFAADRSSWAAVASTLQRCGCHVLTPDLPGHGDTATEVVDIDGLGQGLPALVQSTFGDRGVHVVAHSLGAAPALSLIDHGRVASLTLLAPAGIGLAIDSLFVRGMAAPASRGELSHLLRRLDGHAAARAGTLSESALTALYETLARGRLRILAESLLGASGQTLDLVDAIDRAAQFMPVRIIVGHADRIFDWQSVTTLSPRVAVHHLASAGHMPHREAPELISALLRSWTIRSEANAG